MTNYYSLLATTMGEMSLNKFLQLSDNIQSYPELRPLRIMSDGTGIDMYVKCSGKAAVESFQRVR